MSNNSLVIEAWRIVKLEPKAAPVPEPAKALAQWTTDVEVSAAEPADTGRTARKPNATAAWTTSLKTSAVAGGNSGKPSWTPQIALSVAE